MARQRSAQPRRSRRHWKICHHSPSCGKILAYSSCLCHYRFADYSRMEDSLTPSETPSASEGRLEASDSSTQETSDASMRSQDQDTVQSLQQKTAPTLKDTRTSQKIHPMTNLTARNGRPLPYMKICPIRQMLLISGESVSISMMRPEPHQTCKRRI